MDPRLDLPRVCVPSAKQKLEDRLAAAAREKLAQASKESKEKQLQAERKRKAALFLQTLRSPVPDTEVGRAEESPCSVEVSRQQKPSRPAATKVSIRLSSGKKLQCPELFLGTRGC